MENLARTILMKDVVDCTEQPNANVIVRHYKVRLCNLSLAGIGLYKLSDASLSIKSSGAIIAHQKDGNKGHKGRKRPTAWDADACVIWPCDGDKVTSGGKGCCRVT